MPPFFVLKGDKLIPRSANKQRHRAAWTSQRFMRARSGFIAQEVWKIWRTKSIYFILTPGAHEVWDGNSTGAHPHPPSPSLGGANVKEAGNIRHGGNKWGGIPRFWLMCTCFRWQTFSIRPWMWHRSAQLWLGFIPGLCRKPIWTTLLRFVSGLVRMKGGKQCRRQSNSLQLDRNLLRQLKQSS